MVVFRLNFIFHNSLQCPIAFMFLVMHFDELVQDLMQEYLRSWCCMDDSKNMYGTAFGRGKDLECAEVG